MTHDCEGLEKQENVEIWSGNELHVYDEEYAGFVKVCDMNY